EKIEFGLNRAGEHREYHSVWSLLMVPFNKVGIRSVVVVVVIVVGLAAWIDWKIAPAGWLASKKGEKIELADLTSPELKQMITDGYTTVLLPTGGVEQGGAHLALGKHNFVVDFTAREIARELGKTLVAPTLPFSPAGNADPPTQHMIFPGTMSLPADQFAAVIEAEARDMRAAGFTLICIVPEHGLAVPEQDAVAKKLTEEWQAAGVRVVSIDDYYAKNGQDEALASEGYSAQDIGRHAGMKDTSELWRVDPDGVRPQLREESHDFDHTGVDGDPRKASPEMGDRLLRLKIDAAVTEIRALQKDPGKLAGH
ncbi:MAG TPA: creatininase family protein, partial [Polyangiaceae bacterium]